MVCAVDKKLSVQQVTPAPPLSAEFLETERNYR